MVVADVKEMSQRNVKRMKPNADIEKAGAHSQ